MKKLEKLSTRIRVIPLLFFSIIGEIICLDTFDVTRFLYSGDDSIVFWQTRVVVFKIGASFLMLALKCIDGFPKLNVAFNAGLLICASDIIARLGGDTDRDVWDLIWVGIIITLTIYEYRKRRLRIS